MRKVLMSLKGSLGVVWSAFWQKKATVVVSDIRYKWLFEIFVAA